MSTAPRTEALERLIALAEIPAARVGYETWSQYVIDAETVLGRPWQRIREDISAWRTADVLEHAWAPSENPT